MQNLRKRRCSLEKTRRIRDKRNCTVLTCRSPMEGGAGVPLIPLPKGSGQPVGAPVGRTLTAARRLIPTHPSGKGGKGEHQQRAQDNPGAVLSSNEGLWPSGG